MAIHCQGRAERGLFLKFVGILTKCVGNAKCRALSISSPAEIKLLPAMTAFKEVI